MTASEALMPDPDRDLLVLKKLDEMGRRVTVAMLQWKSSPDLDALSPKQVANSLVRLVNAELAVRTYTSRPERETAYEITEKGKEELARG